MSSRKKSRGANRLSPFSTDLAQHFQDPVTPFLFDAIEVYSDSAVEFEIKFCESVLDRSPSHPEALVVLSEAYTRIGEYEKGLEYDLRLSRLLPENEIVHYNLACSYALTSQPDLALNTLKKAVKLGYHDVEHLQQDQDLESLRDLPGFRSLLDEMLRLNTERV